MSIMLAFFDELDCFGGPRPNDTIPLLNLVDIRAAMSLFSPLLSISNMLPQDTIRPKTGIEEAQLHPECR